MARETYCFATGGIAWFGMAGLAIVLLLMTQSSS